MGNSTHRVTREQRKLQANAVKSPEMAQKKSHYASVVSPPQKKHFGMSSTKQQLSSIRSAIRLYNKLQEEDEENPVKDESKKSGVNVDELNMQNLISDRDMSGVYDRSDPKHIKKALNR